MEYIRTEYERKYGSFIRYSAVYCCVDGERKGNCIFFFMSSLFTPEELFLKVSSFHWISPGLLPQWFQHPNIESNNESNNIFRPLSTVCSGVLDFSVCSPRIRLIWMIMTDWVGTWSVETMTCSWNHFFPPRCHSQPIFFCDPLPAVSVIHCLLLQKQAIDHGEVWKRVSLSVTSGCRQSVRI